MTKGNIFNILEDYFLYVGRSDIKTTSSTVNAIIEIHNAIEKISRLTLSQKSILMIPMK